MPATWAGRGGRVKMAFARRARANYHLRTMASHLSVRNLVSEGWQHGFAALLPNLRWLALLAVAGGAYSAALHMDANLASPFAMVLVTFLAGIQFSRGLYRRLIGPRPGGFLALTHANLAVYLAFLFMGAFVGFFLLILPGILIEAQGKYQLGADAAPELVQRAFLEMLPTAYGVVYVLVTVAGLAVLSYFAIRLTLFGAATVDQGAARVFETFDWTRGQAKTLAAAALATHVLPFAAGLAANAVLRAAVPETAPGHVIEGVGGVLLFAPFLLTGHGMAAAAYRRLKPAPARPGN